MRYLYDVLRAEFFYIMRCFTTKIKCNICRLISESKAILGFLEYMFSIHFIIYGDSARFYGIKHMLEYGTNIIIFIT